MGRRGSVTVRQPISDPIYESILVTKLVNKIMRSGKKQLAQRIVYRAFSLIKRKTKKDPLKVFARAIENIKPQAEVRARRVGGAAYQVPMLVRGRRQETLALRWLVASARERPNQEYHSFTEKLAAEIIDAYNKTGKAVAKREEVEKIADSNRAFAHLRW